MGIKCTVKLFFLLVFVGCKANASRSKLESCMTSNGNYGFCTLSRADCENFGNEWDSDGFCEDKIHVCCVKKNKPEDNSRKPSNVVVENKTPDFDSTQREIDQNIFFCTKSPTPQKIQKCSVIQSVDTNGEHTNQCEFLIANMQQSCALEIEYLADLDCGANSSFPGSLLFINRIMSRKQLDLCKQNLKGVGKRVYLNFIKEKPIKIKQIGTFIFKLKLTFLCCEEINSSNHGDSCCHKIQKLGTEETTFVGNRHPDMDKTRDKAMGNAIKSLQMPTTPDCCSLYKNFVDNGEKSGFKMSGVNNLVINNRNQEVYCDTFKTRILFRSFKDSKMNFTRDFKAYESGFGSRSSSHFIGLKNLYEMTKNKNQALHIVARKFESESCSKSSCVEEFHYSSISISDASDKYRLQLALDYSKNFTGIRGTADSLIGEKVPEAVNPNLMQFSAFDSDNDLSERNCAADLGGGWWHRNCTWLNPFGKIFGKERYQRKSLHMFPFNGLKSLKEMVIYLEPQQPERCGYEPKSRNQPLKNCCEYRRHGSSKSGIYEIMPDETGDKIDVLCDMHTDGGGWTTIQRRTLQGPNVSFYRTYEEYEEYFGIARKGSYWIGLANIFSLTKDLDQEVRFDMLSWERGSQPEKQAFAVYSHFSVAAAEDNYRLSISGYRGDAGNALLKSGRSQNGARFSSYDADNDASSYYNCAEIHQSGWWFNRCQPKREDYAPASPNGILAKEFVLHNPRFLYWYSFDFDSSLKQFEIKIRPKNINKCSF